MDGTNSTTLDTTMLKAGTSFTYQELTNIFDQLEPVSIDQMIGRWQGSEFVTGHYIEGALATSGWYGKEFRDAESVHPLVYYADKNRTKTFQINPMLTSFHPLLINLMKKNYAHSIVRAVKWLVGTKRYTARLRMQEYRGKVSATMIYDALPICDVFRKIDDNRVLGVMDLRGMEEPYFFMLERVF